MAEMDPQTLKALLSGSQADALSAIQSSTLSSEREDAMDYYLGDMTKDMPTQEGRSQTVSTDVSDTIEGMLPQLMDIVAGTDEVVRFNPIGPEDEEAAQQESDYVNHVLMQTNDGFQVLYHFAKDGLLSKTGLVKVWWDEREQEERETYYGLTEDQFVMLSHAVAESDGAMKIVEHTVNNEPGSEATS